jgi:RES domain-containing protein
VHFKGRAFRAHDPSWSFSPLSGDGAKTTGGRFNRKGDAALYLSLDVMTAIMEVTQGLTNRLHPLTMCEYDIDCTDIADLRDDTKLAAHWTTYETLSSPWLHHQLAGKAAPSQSLAKRLQNDGCAGAIVPSFAPGARGDDFNLVLWKWGPKLPHKVTVFDPGGRLPKDRLSWR